MSSVVADIEAKIRSLSLQEKTGYHGAFGMKVVDEPVVIGDSSRLRALGWAPRACLLQAGGLGPIPLPHPGLLARSGLTRFLLTVPSC
jgi:hypothetical protein